MEVNILKFYNWEVLIPTAVHFIDYYSLFILCSSDAIEGESVYNSERIKVCVQKYMEYFQNMILLGKFTMHYYCINICITHYISMSNSKYFM